MQKQGKKGPSVLATFLKIPALLQGSICSLLGGAPAEPCSGCPGGPAARRDISSRHGANQSVDRSYWARRVRGWRSQHLPAARPWDVPVRSLLLAGRRRCLLQNISLPRGLDEAPQLPLLNDKVCDGGRALSLLVGLPEGLWAEPRGTGTSRGRSCSLTLPAPRDAEERTFENTP